MAKSGTRCGCSGACCGEQDYGQMWQAFRDKYTTGGTYAERDLRQIHVKWRKIVSQL